MSDTSGFRISQGLDVLPPKSGNAYPIPCDEWNFLKGKLGLVSDSPWMYQNLASLFVGVGLATFVTIIMGLLPPLSQSSYAIVIAWAVVAVMVICGLTCLHFAQQQKKMRSVHVSEVIRQMEIIERRYEVVTGDASKPTASR